MKGDQIYFNFYNFLNFNMHTVHIKIQAVQLLWFVMTSQDIIIIIIIIMSLCTMSVEGTFLSIWELWYQFSLSNLVPIL